MRASPTRFRWFTLRPFDAKLLRKLADGMLAAKFHEETGFGFILGDVRKDKVTGRFIRKETITRSITNLQGETKNVQFVDFSTTRFTLFTSFPNMELENPPRRLTEFLTALGDILENKIAIIPVEATCQRWLETLAEAGCSVRTTKIVTGSIAISDTVAVKAIFSGTRDVQKEALTFLKGKKIASVEIAGELEHDGVKGKFRLSGNGVFTLPSAPPEELLAAIRNACKPLVNNTY